MVRKFFHDPASEDPWKSGAIPPLVYVVDDVAHTPYRAHIPGNGRNDRLEWQAGHKEVEHEHTQ